MTDSHGTPLKVAKPIVSVILGPQVEPAEALESLNVQTFTEFETILPPAGQSIGAARNEGIRSSQASYIAFLDSGSVWKPRKLEMQVARLTTNADAGWCYCNASNFETALDSGQVLGQLLLSNFIPPGSVMARRSLFADIGYFEEDPSHSPGCDWDMWLRMAAEYSVDCLAERLVTVAAHAAEMECRDIEREYAASVRVVENTVASFPRLLTDLRCRALAEICVDSGNRYLRANRRMDARHKFAEALTHNPTCSEAYLNWVSSFLSAEAQQQIQDLQGLTLFTRSGESQSRTQASSARR